MWAMIEKFLADSVHIRQHVIHNLHAHLMTSQGKSSIWTTGLAEPGFGAAKHASEMEKVLL